MASQITKPTLTPSESDKFLDFEVTINFRSAEPLKYSSSSNNKPSKKILERKRSETRHRKSQLIEHAPNEKNSSSEAGKQVVPKPVKIRTSNDQPKVEKSESKSEKKPQSEKEKKPKERTTKRSEELAIQHEPVVETPEELAKEGAKAAPTKKLEKLEPVLSRSPSLPRKSDKSKREKPTVIEPEPVTKAQDRIEAQPSESPKSVDKNRISKRRTVPSPTESVYESSEAECFPDEMKETCSEVELKDCSAKLVSSADGKMSFVMLGIDLEAMTVQVFPCPTDKKNELPGRFEARERCEDAVLMTRRARS